MFCIQLIKMIKKIAVMYNIGFETPEKLSVFKRFRANAAFQEKNVRKRLV